ATALTPKPAKGQKTPAKKAAPVLPTTYDDRACMTCHTELTRRPFRHSLFKDGNCSDCHVPALRPSNCDGTVSVGGRKTSTKTSAFSVEVSITGWRHKEPEPKLCTRCHEGIVTDENVHPAIRSGGCATCHNAHSSDLKKLLNAPVQKLCQECHRKDDRRYVHEPVAKGECMACHDPHTGLDKPLLKEERKALCDACHARPKLSPAKHAKMKGDCFECHMAHASDSKGLLKAPPTPEVSKAPPPAEATYSDSGCAKCHAGLTKKQFRHSIFKDGACGDCHVPSERPGACKEPVGKGWTLRQPDPALCVKCHDKLQHKTPLHKTIEVRGCSGCHDPHSSDLKNELRAPVSTLCYRCHARQDTMVGTHPPVLRRECLTCHDPHSGQAKPLLKAEPNALCADCHKADQVLPAGEPHEPVTKGRCIECHAPHSSSSGSLLVASGKELCLTCHEKGKLGRDGNDAAKKVITLKGAVSIHGPIQKDECQSCHVQTHTSKLPKQLKTPGVRLCLSCHDKVLGTERLHRVIDEKGCAACHLPHTSENKKLLTQWPIEKLCHECHERKDLKENLASVHAPVQMGECLECHDPHAGEQKPMLKVRRDDLCFQCHDLVDLAPRPEVHSPVKEGKCFACHDPHGSETPRLLVAAPAALCMKCHDAKSPDKSIQAFARIDLSKKVVHRPVVEKDCQECHVPGHSSKVKKLLKKKPAGLCYGCHERKDKDPFVHGAVSLGDCVVCHRPHSSDQKNLAPWGREAKLCFECHEDDLSAREVLHRPVAEGRCSKCHDPHGAKNPFNITLGRGPQVCLKCHEKIDVDVKVKHSALVRYGCTGCHDPHGTANPSMLPKPINEVCQRCHEKIKDGSHAANMMKGGHIVTGDFDPRRPDKTFSCASCHNPHGSNNPNFFYYGKDTGQMCDGCHGDRLGISPDLKDVSKKKKPKLPDGGVPVALRYDAGWLGPEVLVEVEESPARKPQKRPLTSVDGGDPFAEIHGGGTP
ncbi:MAG: cytochrome c3 family protein, partial [Deltaproteobacteria bacterium]|nr:cytochrome c3 family protein [Deltaproteobacteria bacterium]